MAGDLIIVDVDGVLSPDPGAAKHAGGFTDWKKPYTTPKHPGGGRYHARISPTMGARLAALDGTIVWLTTWQHDANRYLLHRLSWPPRAVIDWWDGTYPVDHRDKAAGLARWLPTSAPAGGWRRAVWVDDELGTDGALDFSVDGHPNPLEQAGIDHLLVAPDPTVGLTVAELDHLARWITS